MAQGSHYPWKDAVLSPSWSFLEETGPRWWSISLPSICPTCNNAFHGLIKHMVSAPNSLLEKYVHGAFSGLFAYGYMMWTRMVVIWVLLKICVIMFFHREKLLKKQNKKQKRRWGSYTWYWNYLCTHLDRFGSCIYLHNYREALVYNLQHGPKIQCCSFKKNGGKFGGEYLQIF